jgi:hypothetical protein
VFSKYTVVCVHPWLISIGYGKCIGSLHVTAVKIIKFTVANRSLIRCYIHFCIIKLAKSVRRADRLFLQIKQLDKWRSER